MGSIPIQRESVFSAQDAPDQPTWGPVVARTSLPGNPLAPAAARRFLRAAFAEWTELPELSALLTLDGRLVDDATVVLSELVTNAVVHAGTGVDLLCRLEDAAPDGGATAGLVVEVTDRHPARAVRNDRAFRSPETPEYGRGLQLVASLAELWGITYGHGTKTVWARIPADAPTPAAEIPDSPARVRSLQRGLRAAEILTPASRRAPQDLDWINRGALSFLAEASDLLAGQLDEDMVAALVGQLLVPRLADWCAIWFYEEEGRGLPGVVEHDVLGAGPMQLPRLARVWHTHEHRIEELRGLLEKEPPRLPDRLSGAVPVPWPFDAQGSPVTQDTGSAVAYRLSAGGRALGILLIGRAGLHRFPDEVTGLVEDFSRRVALAVSAARRFTRQATISRILQRGLLPTSIAEIPGMKSALVYEPKEAGGPGGDFYDVFPAGAGRWCFALGDVQGKGPEAAVVIGLVRPWLRLLAREEYQVSQVLDRLNRLLLDDATEASDAAARALAAADGRGVPPEGSTSRFLSLLYGELTPTEDGVLCTLASAGHPLPLLMRPGGEVVAAAAPQVLLGVVDDPDYTSETFVMGTGDTLLGVTDGVTERRRGALQFDDGDGLAQALAGCAGLTAPLLAERIRRLVHAFGDSPPDDDLALLVLQAQ
ncbi:SpoIIE family protein phosphatase [Streptomyces endophyticus]|uniref:SpoIIE family protein phosphatase n=1 Tax=Streptomyces endophyticus TaxID=714166 RepID=A0ABU6F036_9ACTN|nr:SpoIIE family protein phosphatase [Streptomyces endophyticus]MEB8337007.1 SpoIIE family protein phosphatase [Streptomyces endophyticus]